MPTENQQKQRLIDSLTRGKNKYGKTFQEGKMTEITFLGGDWNTYANVVLSLVIADTLLSIDKKMDQLLEKSQQG